MTKIRLIGHSAWYSIFGLDYSFLEENIEPSKTHAQKDGFKYQRLYWSEKYVMAVST